LADYGLWAGSAVRGELSATREHAAAFLSDVQARPDSPEAGVAHRISGTTRLLAGEYLEAREHLERSIALLQPGRSDDLAFSFGHDAIAAAMLYLAMTLWPMGEVERVASFEAEAAARTAETTHIGALAYGKALRGRRRCRRLQRRRLCSRAWREPASAVKPISRSQ
jgi:hypothetical protein